MGIESLRTLDCGEARLQRLGHLPRPAAAYGELAVA